MLKRITLTLFTVFFLMIGTSEVSASNAGEFTDSEEWSNAEFTTDASFVGQVNSLGSDVSPLSFDVGGGGSLTKPRSINTNTIDVEGKPLEYAVVNGEFVIFKEDGTSYYTQRATQGWFNAATANVTKSAANITGTYLTYRGAEKLPFIKRIFEAETKDPIFNWGFLTAAGSAMVQYNVPFWGDIVSASVPSVGTQEVLVYLSDTGKANTWHHRVLFEVQPNGTVSYSTQYVK